MRNKRNDVTSPAVARPTRVHKPASRSGDPSQREAPHRAPSRRAAPPARPQRARPAPAPEREVASREVSRGIRAIARLVRPSRVLRVWTLKAAIQKAISLAPASHRVNYLFQRYVTGGVELDERFLDDRLTHLRSHLTGYREIAGRPHPRTTLELGTGWYPVVPIALHLAGADRINTVDITPLTTRERTLATVEALLELHGSGRLSEYLFAHPERVRALEGVRAEAEGLSNEAILERLGVRLLVTDARNLPLPDGSIDLVHSNNTFEHVPPAVLAGILAEFDRVAAPGSVQSHFIDMSDHFAHLDKSITIYNYLRFSDRAWRLIDNDVQPQNRLRYGDYTRMYQELGLPVVKEFHRPGDVEALASVPLHASYRDRDPAELAISHCHLYSAPASA
jgi:hypothetical protein